ncbi:hypothetical protein [Vibrio sp. V39_P1S14PM300]|uniref:hypothetical protein n=1 Tax=Vibrio sp. V39_P1S14PM300 TaxID=1938690 RepID=UPI0013726474|nr:hypothetical protein [Vibrio sp. V39_P1S14PM300]NAX19988.1 hypothetical protein [Vibrio sp. V39_P1S14PM300]
MQQGMLSSLLLISSLLLPVSPLSATEMSPQVIEQWAHDDQIKHKVDELMQLVKADKIDSLNFALERLALPQQEVARYRLLSEIEQQDLILTPKMALFIERQQAQPPVYQILERGDGYEFSVPAFDYPAIAFRLLKRWRQDQTTLDFVLMAERGELDLQHWLSGSDYQLQTREALLIRELDSLSPRALTALTQQLTQAKVTSWLPSSQVMVRLAQVSDDPEVYKLLWLMRADSNTRDELLRLAARHDPFSLHQVILATANPSLKEDALKALTRVKPMPQEVQQFLIERMGNSDEAPLVARHLAEQGYGSWLRDLADSNQQVKSRAILQAIAQ